MPSIYEVETSRSIAWSIKSPNTELRYVVLGTYDESAVATLLLSTSPTTHFGLLRAGYNISPLGAGNWECSVKYEAVDEFTSPGNPGSEGSEPTVPGSTDPLSSEFAFDTSGGTQRIYTALETISRTARAGVVAVDYKDAINPTKDGVEGIDVVKPVQMWSRTIGWTYVTLAYLDILEDLTGKVNNATFYGKAAGEVRFMGAKGNGRTGEEFRITYEFATAKNLTNIPVPANAAIITVPAKKGWEYLQAYYSDGVSGNRKIKVLDQVDVQKHFELGDFSLLGIGT